MQVSSAIFYFAVMALLIAEAAALSLVLPLERALLAEDKAAGRLLALDGLRGLLAPSVFLHHAVLYFYFARNGDWSEMPSNFYAQMGVLPVTLFFFITGYLFWKKLMKNPTLGMGAFVRDRLRRLGGAYWLACMLLFGAVAVKSAFVRQVSWSRIVLEVLGWISFLGAGHDVNHLLDSKRLLGQVWTLRLERMFYLSLPFCGWFARRRIRLVLLLACAMVLSLLIGRVTLQFSVAANYGWKMLGNYAHVLLVTFSGGMIVAAVPIAEKFRIWTRSGYATLLSGVLLVMTAVKVRPEYGVLETLTLILPFACVCFGNTWFGLLTSRPLRLLGRMSYSFYLLHVFVLQAGVAVLSHFAPVGLLDAWQYWSFIAVCGGCAVAASYLSYELLEYRFMQNAKIGKMFAATTSEEGTIYDSPLKV